MTNKRFIFKIMPINQLPQREEYLKKKRNRKIIKWSLLTALFLVIAIGLSYASYRPKLRISKVVLSGGILVTQEDVWEKSLSFLKGSYFWIAPHDNAFIYPRKALEKHLKESFKRIDTIDMHREDFNTIVVTITERKPVATWCNRLPGQVSVSLKSPNDYLQCYFIDQNSTIFAEAPYFSGDAYFKYYGLVSTSTPIGTYYIASSTLFDEISEFIERTKQMSIRPIYLIAKDNGEFSLVIEGGGEIYFDLKEPLSKTTSNLEALLRTPALSTSTSSILPIQYIDLRFSNKLFYKLKGE